MSDEAELVKLMERFRLAYASQNRDELMATTDEGFVWQQHFANDDSELPSGKAVEGVSGLLAVLQWRSEHWTNVRYRDLEERSAGDMLVQTFTISGEEDGKPFHAKAVDLYRLRNDRIAIKETYWKQMK